MPKAKRAPEPPTSGQSTGGPTATAVVLADIALRGGSRLLSMAVNRALLGRNGSGKLVPRSLGGKLVGTALTRVAMRSVPGALVVGGGLLAKTLYDRRRSKAAVDKRAKSERQDVPDA